MDIASFAENLNFLKNGLGRLKIECVIPDRFKTVRETVRLISRRRLENLSRSLLTGPDGINP